MRFKRFLCHSETWVKSRFFTEGFYALVYESDCGSGLSCDASAVIPDSLAGQTTTGRVLDG